MASTITYGPSSLQVVPQSSNTSGSPVTFSGVLDGTLSSLEYKITLFSDTGTSVVDWTGVEYETNGTTWTATIPVVPIGPSGSDYNDWYDTFFRFSYDGGASEDIQHAIPWGVGIVAWGVLSQSNIHFWGPDANYIAHTIAMGSDGIGLTGTSGISCLSAARPCNGVAPEWIVPDGSGCSYFTSSLHETFQRPVGFVQLANGSTPLFKDYDTILSYIYGGRGATGKKGAWLSEQDELWRDCVTVYKAYGAPHFIITCQGEADNEQFHPDGKVVKVEEYKAGFEVALERLRTLVGKPELPALIAQLPGYNGNAGAWLGAFQSYSNIMRAQTRICDDDPNCHLLTINDLPRTLTDPYHLTPAGYADFAVRAGQMYTYLQSSGTVYQGPKITSLEPIDASSFYVKVTHTAPATTWEESPGYQVSGFEVLDSFYSIAPYEFNLVSSAEIYDDTRIKVYLTRELSGTVKFGYFNWGAMLPIDGTYGMTVSSIAKDNQGLPLQTFDGWVPFDIDGTGFIPFDKFKDSPYEVSAFSNVLLNSHDAGSTLVNDAIDLYLSSNTFYTNLEPRGPFYKFLKALSWSLYDINMFVEDLETLVDIERCPKEFFAYLAKLIGWHLISEDLDSWRAQLRQAIYIYKTKGTRNSLEAALKLIFPDKSFNPTNNITELWESYIPNLIYYIIKTESPYHLEGWTSEKSKELDIPYSNLNPDWNVRYCVDFILARIEERNPGFINSIPDFDFGETLFEYRGRSDNIVPPFEKERWYSTKYVWPEHRSYINYHLSSSISQKGLNIPTSAIEAMWNFFDSSAVSGLLQGSNQKWKFFTSSMELPFNYDKVMKDPYARFSNDLHYWSGKSSSVLLELSTGDFDFDLDQFKNNSKYAVEAVADILKDFKPFHVVFEFILYHDMADDVDVEDLFLGWDINFYFCEPITDNAVAGYHTSSMAMVSGSGNLPRGQNNGLPNSNYDNSSLYIPQISNVPRKSLRRRNRKYTNRVCKVYKRDGLASPIPAEYLGTTGTYGSLSAPISSTGFLQKGFNPSSGQFFVPASSHGGIYKPRYAPTDEYSGIPLSACYPCRSLTGVDSVRTVLRSSLTPYQIALIRARQRQADEELIETTLSSNPEFNGYFPRGNPWTDGKTLDNIISDTEFGRELNRIWNDDYTDICQGRMYEDYADARWRGGPYFASHLLGPLVFNGNLIAEGSDTDNTLTGSVLAGSGALGEDYITTEESTVTITAVSLSNDLSTTYNIEGSATRVESTSHLSGVVLGSSPDSRSFIVNNSLETSSYRSDTTERSYERSLSIYNKDAKGDTTMFPYIQFNLGSSANVFTTSADNGLLPNYEYQVDLLLRDSDFFERSDIGIALFVDDFHGETYYFDFDEQIWKHRDCLISVNRKDNPVRDYNKIYKLATVSSGDFVTTKTSKLYDPRRKTYLYSTNQRNLTFKFNTKNIDIVEPRSVRGHARQYNGLHHLTTNYSLRVIKYSNEGAFVSFDDISVRNLTYEKLANDYYLIRDELLDIYEQFDYDRTALQSRDASVMSGTHELSGGSRHVYLDPASWSDLSGVYQLWTVDLGANSVSASIYDFSDG